MSGGGTTDEDDDVHSGDGGEGGDQLGRRSVRYRSNHHRMAPADRWPAAGATTDSASPGAVAAAHHHSHHHHHHHQHRHDVIGNGTAAVVAAAARTQHVLQAAPASMCYTTNEVLVIIAVTCFLNFAFILLIMTCVHCFTDPSHHKKFGAVAYTELGDELFDSDMVDGDTVTLLNPTKPWPHDGGPHDCAYERKRCPSECDSETCAAPCHSLMHEHRCAGPGVGKPYDDDPFPFDRP